MSPYHGGDEEARTPDPLLAKQVLSQLSYTPAHYTQGLATVVCFLKALALKIKQYWSLSKLALRFGFCLFASFSP